MLAWMHHNVLRKRWGAIFRSRAEPMIARSLFAGVLLAVFSVAEPVPQGPSAGSAQELEITVSDDNGVPVPAAHVFLQASQQNIPQRCETDFAGHCQFDNLRPQEVY